MKVKVREDIFLENLTYNEEYEIITILFLKWNLAEKEYSIFYFLFNDNYEITYSHESDFVITDSHLDTDFIYEERMLLQRYTIPDQRVPTYALYPKSVDISCLYYAFEYTEPIEIDTSFCERFKHLLPEYKYAECFKERYQDPNISLTAEPIGENWVLCPECNEAFEVDKNQGVVTCTNIACRVKMNNPYAKKLPKQEDFYKEIKGKK